MEKKNNAGAIASNAGDDFHLIWACKTVGDFKTKQRNDSNIS